MPWIDPGRRFDAVFSNPPYIRGRMSRLSSSSEKSLAKHEILCDIFDIMRGTRAFLKENGRAYFIYPGKRRKDFTEAMNAHGLRLGVLRSVLSREGEEAVLFLAECDGASGETDIREPLILYGPDGKYTAEAEAIDRRQRLRPLRRWAAGILVEGDCEPGAGPLSPRCERDHSNSN